MNLRHLFLLFCGICASPLRAQVLVPPCDIQARISIAICFDPPGCLLLNTIVENGNPPYTYLWDTGSTQSSIGYGPNPPSVCHTVTITDAMGCHAVASDSTTFELLASDIAHPDTFWTGETAINFDVSENDSIFLDDFLLVQAPLHGTITLNSDGTGQYIPNGDWCGPDYFRYAARSNCKYTSMITSVIMRESCAGIIVTKSDCNSTCSGNAHFYNGNLLPEPLTFQWSSGEQGIEANQLCEGVSEITVTDGLGNLHLYSVEIQATTLEADITGLSEVCGGQHIYLNSQISLDGEPNILSQYWFGSLLPSEGYNSDYVRVGSFYRDSLYQFKLVVRSLLGCTDSAFHQTYVHSGPNAAPIVLEESIKYSPDTLRLSTSVAGGTPPLTYIWTGPQGVFSDYPELVWPDVTSLFSGQYRLKVIDRNGCFDTEFRSVYIQDSVSITISISTPDYPICANSDYRLLFGVLGGSWIEPEASLWTGPDNFSSTELRPMLENVHIGMSGMYYLSLTYGSQVLRDSFMLNISPNSADVELVSLVPPTTCSSPTNSSVTLDVDAPGPFMVDVINTSTFNFASSPFDIPNMRPGFYNIVTITTGHSDLCRIPFFVSIPYPDSVSIQTTAASCDGTGGSASLISIPQANRVSWFIPGYPSGADTIFHVENIPSGGYNARVFGASGCQYNISPITIDPFFNFDVRIDERPDCDNDTGALSVIWENPPTTSITYAWSNGANTATNQNLSKGWYSVTVSDETGCSTHRNIYLPANQACLSSISGRVFANMDCFCAADGNVFAVPRVRVCATNGSYTDCAYTDHTGAYLIALPYAGPYQLSISHDYPYMEENCIPPTITIVEPAEIYTGQNIFLCAESVSNAEIIGFCNTARPGFSYEAKFRVKNTGTITIDSAWVSATISPLIEVSTIVPIPYSFDPGTNQVTWRFNQNIRWQAHEDFTIKGTTIGTLGDTIVNSAEVTIGVAETYLTDNIFECYDIVTGSYDPNDKLVTPMGRGSNGEILRSDSLLTYTIRFQNTGTDTAFTVVIRDTLDRSVFDIHSVRPQISSHPHQLDVEGDNILVFTFENIMLPDSGRSQAGSQGYVIFNIELLEDLVPGTAISNTAAIYFDYNDPIITNVTLNTLTPIHEVHQPEPELILYPNPSSGETTAIIGLSQTSYGLKIGLYDMQGNCLMEHAITSRLSPGEYVFPLNLRQWPSGVYILQLQTELGAVSRKLVLQH